MFDDRSPLETALRQGVWINNSIRLGGAVLLLIGVWLSYSLVKRLLDTVQNSKDIKAFAAQIEKDSGLNHASNLFLFETRSQAIAALRETRRTMPTSKSAAVSAGWTSDARSSRTPKKGEQIDFVYLLSWFLFLLIMGLAVRISLGILHKGAQILLDSAVPSEAMQAILREIQKQRNR
ncbi:MAG: hypothetical protein H6728_04465 [Myxococcales bacterium]|nr:hypothetical protein [Myxococcales bacterium]MCB9642306.1 hypothetical protein [Myxococcales bacterium]